MKPALTLLSCLICIQLLACCNKSDDISSTPNDTLNTGSMKIKITVGTNAFTATLYNNATTTAFKARLPLTINMKELNGNEKYFDLPNNLPASASNPGTIQTGDLMLSRTNTLLHLYKTITTSYSYTIIARVDKPAGLTAALGSVNITVKFESE